MKSESRPTSPGCKLEYLNTISERQQTNTNKLPWLNSVIFLFTGSDIVYGVVQYQKDKEKNKGAK